MEDFKELFKKKNNLITLLVFGILVLAIPVGVSLIKNQQIIKSRAGGEPIVIKQTADVFQRAKAGGTQEWVAKKDAKISLELTSPLTPSGPVQSSDPATSASPIVSTCAGAAVSLSPSSGNILLNQNNEIDVKLTPGDCDITAVEFGLNYVSTTLNVISALPGVSSFGIVEAGGSGEGGKHYIFTRTPGTTLTQEMIIGKIIFKPTASAAASAGVFINIVGVAGSDGLPYITVSGQGELPASKKSVTSGTYNLVAQ